MEPDTKALATVAARYAQPDPHTISKLPKGGAQLDYMGHAEVTLALLDCDPLWTLEPTAIDPATGGPTIGRQGDRFVMWAWLTVCGHRRLCVGTCEARKADPEKELVGDAMRNGAMRFGIGTKLWSKADSADPAGSGPGGGYERKATRAPSASTTAATSANAITDAQMKKLMACMNEHGLVERVSRLTFTSEAIGRTVETAKDLTRAEAAKVIDALEALEVPA